MDKKKILLILLVVTIGVLAIFTGGSQNKSSKKEMAISPLSVGSEITEGREYNLENYLTISDCYVMINGEKINSSTVFPVEYGDLIDIHLAWNLPNSGLILTTNDTFIYELPSNLKFSNIENGPVRDGSEIIGYYSINNNKVTIKYTDEDFVKQSNIIGTLNVSGEVTSDTTPGENGGRVDLEIPGVGTFPVYVQPEGSLSLNKTINKKIDTDTYEYKLEVKSVEENTEVIIGDNLGDYLHLDKNSIKIEKNGTDITDSVNIYYDQFYGSNTIEFIFMIDKMANDDIITVTYRADVDEKGFIWDYNDSNNQYQTLMNLTNIAGVVSKENPTWLYDSTTVETGKGAVLKYGNYNNGAVNWTIYVMPGEKGVTLTDVLGDNQYINVSSLIAGKYLYVYETDINDSDPVLSTLRITPEDLANGYTFAPDPTGEKVYIIATQTIVTDNGKYEGEVKNTAIINLGNTFYKEEAIVQIGPPVINKELSSANEKEAILTWNSVLKAPENGLKNVIFKDILGTGLTLIEESVKVNGVFIGDTNYVFTKTEYGFEIDFGDINLGDVFDISYDTNFDNSSSSVFVNEAVVTATGGINVSDDAYYEYNKKSNYITKYVDNKGSENSHETGIVSWQIDIDQMPEGTEKAYIDDIIPDGMEYIEGSAKLVLNKNPYTTYSLKPTINENVLTFDITDYMDQIQGDNGVSIFYQSRALDAFSEKTYVNKAYITIDDKKYPEVSASISGKVTKLVDKSAVYNALTAPDVHYTIEVNKGALDLDKDSETITLDDHMGKALAFIMGTLEVNGKVWNDYTWDPDTRVLTITVPDSKALTITYKARVNLSVGEDLTSENAYNNVKIYGYDDEWAEGGYELIGGVLESSATSTGDSKIIYVYKYKDGVMNMPMKDAEFELIECEHEGSGDSFRLTGEEKVVDTLVTDSTGYASYSGIAYDHVYKLVETKTNDGYILDDEERYFVYPGTDGTEYPDYISQKRDTWTFYINNNYSKTNINVQKTWDDNNYKDRPSYVNVYLKQNNEYVLDGGNKVFKVLNANNNWKASFENLEKYDNNGNLYNYTVEEEVPVNYGVSYNYTDGVNQKKVLITNTLTKGNLTLSKTVTGTAGELTRDFTFKIELFDDENNVLTDTFNYTGSKTGSITSGNVVTLKHGESITINGLPLGTKYKVTENEANTDGYTTTSTNDSGTIDFGSQSTKFTNTKNKELSDLTLSKTVLGTAGELTRDFTFKIELFDEENNALTETFNYTGSKTGSITSGSTVTLKHGESITIKDLPVGTKYKVTENEANTDGYTTTSTNDNGTITKDTQIVNFVNTKNEIPKSSLTLSKSVLGTAGELTRDFTFKIELFDEEDNALTETFNYTGSKTGSITSGSTVTLKHGESITIKDLPVGTKYKVTENEANTGGYTTTSTNASGTVTDKGIIVSFVNTKNEIPKGSLTIDKVVSGNAGELTRDFTFKIELFDDEDNVLTETFNYTGSKTGSITSGSVVTLKHGESITIKDLPVGTKYKVTENEANTDGYITTSENNTGTIIKGNTAVHFENNKTEIPVLKGFLTINKTVTGAGDKNQYFNFKVEFTDENGNVLTDIFNYAGSRVGNIKSGEIITLKHGDSITIINLPKGTKYKVTENEANTNGYITTSENAEGVIDVNGAVASFINHKEEAEKENKTLYIPKTGGNDYTIFYGLGATLSATIFTILYRRKNNEA